MYLQVDIAQDLRGILIRIGRFKSMELHYTKVHLKPIKQLWEDFDSKQPPPNKLATEKSQVERLSTTSESQSTAPAILFSSWLPNFYDELLLYLEQEWKWYSSHSLIPILLDSESLLFRVKNSNFIFPKLMNSMMILHLIYVPIKVLILHLIIIIKMVLLSCLLWKCLHNKKLLMCYDEKLNSYIILSANCHMIGDKAHFLGFCIFVFPIVIFTVC